MHQQFIFIMNIYQEYAILFFKEILIILQQSPEKAINQLLNLRSSQQYPPFTFLMSKYPNRLLVNLLMFILSAYMTHQQYSTDCHYSCKYCVDPEYSQCYLCQDQFQITILGENTGQGNFNTLLEYPRGSCIGILSPVNILGIILLIILFIALILTRNRVFFYFISSIQSLSLIAILQIGYLNPLSYVIQSFEWFMLLINVNKFFNTYDYSLYNSKRYRLSNVFYQVNIPNNIILVGSIGLLSFLVVFLFPIVRWILKKCYRKQVQKQDNNKSMSQIIPKTNAQSNNLTNNRKQQLKRQQNLNFNKNGHPAQGILKNIELTFSIIFFFTIQQTILLFAIGIKYSKNGLSQADITLIVVYAIILSLMLANQCLKQFRVFPNKIIQATDTLKKTSFPLFLIMPYDYGFFILIFIFLLNLIQLFCIKKMSMKQPQKIQKLKKQQNYGSFIKFQQFLGRQFNYRLIQEVAIVLIVIFYVVDTLIKNYYASLTCSIISFIGFIAFIGCIFFQIVKQIRYKVDIQQNIVPEEMDNRNQVKFKNRQMTQQNILLAEDGFVQTFFLNNLQAWPSPQAPKIKRKQRQENVFNQQILEEQKPRKTLQLQLQNYQQNGTHRSQKTRTHTPKHSTAQLPSNNSTIDPLTPKSKAKRRDKNRIKSSLGTQTEQKIQAINLYQNSEQKSQIQLESGQKLKSSSEQQKQQGCSSPIQQLKKQQDEKAYQILNLNETKDPKKKQLRQRYGMLKPVKKRKKSNDIMMNN